MALKTISKNHQNKIPERSDTHISKVCVKDRDRCVCTCDSLAAKNVEKSENGFSLWQALMLGPHKKLDNQNYRVQVLIHHK